MPRDEIPKDMVKCPVCGYPAMPPVEVDGRAVYAHPGRNFPCSRRPTEEDADE